MRRYTRYLISAEYMEHEQCNSFGRQHDLHLFTIKLEKNSRLLSNCNLNSYPFYTSIYIPTNPHSLLTLPSNPTLAKCPLSISPTFRHPANPIHNTNSSYKILNANSTPACPSYTNPQIGILPIHTPSAPNANALKISLPRLIPPSTCIGIWPLAAATHSGRASRVEVAESS